MSMTTQISDKPNTDVSPVREETQNEQPEIKYSIKEDLEASRSILLRVASKAVGFLDTRDEDLSLALCCAAGSLEFAFSGKITDVADGFEDVTDGCITNMHGDHAILNVLIGALQSDYRQIEDAEALIHACDRLVRSAKMIIEFETRRKLRSV